MWSDGQRMVNPFTGWGNMLGNSEDVLSCRLLPTILIRQEELGHRLSTEAECMAEVQCHMLVTEPPPPLENTCVRAKGSLA